MRAGSRHRGKRRWGPDRVRRRKIRSSLVEPRTTNSMDGGGLIEKKQRDEAERMRKAAERKEW